MRENEERREEKGNEEWKEKKRRAKRREKRMRGTKKREICAFSCLLLIVCALDIRVHCMCASMLYEVFSLFMRAHLIMVLIACVRLCFMNVCSLFMRVR